MGRSDTKGRTAGEFFSCLRLMQGGKQTCSFPQHLTFYGVKDKEWSMQIAETFSWQKSEFRLYGHIKKWPVDVVSRQSLRRM